LANESGLERALQQASGFFNPADVKTGKILSLEVTKRSRQQNVQGSG